MSNTNKPEAAPQKGEKLPEKNNAEKPGSEKETGKTTEASGSVDKGSEINIEQRLSDLENREKLVSERESAVEIREQNAEAKEKELEQLEESLLTESTAEENEPGLEFELDEEKFKFLDSAPKVILFGGKARTQKQLIKDENALTQLVSNISLIEKIQ
jgi:hypothetical protein